jgi:hypothetical protein
MIMRVGYARNTEGQARGSEPRRIGRREPRRIERRVGVGWSMGHRNVGPCRLTIVESGLHRRVGALD